MLRAFTTVCQRQLFKVPIPCISIPTFPPHGVLAGFFPSPESYVPLTTSHLVISMSLGDEWLCSSSAGGYAVDLGD